MTSMAVTASICENVSEAALLVASFMPISLDLGMAHRSRESTCDGLTTNSERPAPNIRLY